MPGSPTCGLRSPPTRIHRNSLAVEIIIVVLFPTPGDDVLVRVRDVTPCSLSVEKYPDNKMLGRREIVDGKVGDRRGPRPSSIPAPVLAPYPRPCASLFFLYVLLTEFHCRLFVSSRVLRLAATHGWLTSRYTTPCSRLGLPSGAVASARYGRFLSLLFVIFHSERLEWFFVYFLLLSAMLMHGSLTVACMVVCRAAGAASMEPILLSGSSVCRCTYYSSIIRNPTRNIGWYCVIIKCWIKEKTVSLILI
jgi:hypothetical protein